MKKQNEVIENLIETLRDGQQGFKEAAESVKDPQLKSLFSEYSKQRARFLAELRNNVQSPDERETKVSGSAAGALHRGWINLKSAVTKGDDHSVLAECERGEDSAVEEYQKALNDGLSHLSEKLWRGNTPRSKRPTTASEISAILPKTNYKRMIGF
jgi:uncharacterized protein (TIGR02284 family)